jgi:hypothetical protein
MSLSESINILALRYDCEARKDVIHSMLLERNIFKQSPRQLLVMIAALPTSVPLSAHAHKLG